MSFNFNKRHFGVAFATLASGWLFINYVFFTSKGQLAFHSDFISILEWAWEGKENYLKTFGIYMPIIPYVAAGYAFFFDSFASLLDKAVYLKSFFILIDAASFALVVAILPIESVKRVVLYSILLLANVALIYNSIFWGQVDTLHTLLIFSCFLMLMKQRYKLVWGVFALAVMTKIVSIIFLPIIALFILNELFCKRIHLKQALLDFMVALAVMVVVFLPIMLTNNLFDYLVLTKQVLTEYDSISSNAYNVYYLISNRDDLIATSSEAFIFRSWTYNQFGLVTFSISFFVCLLPAFKTIILNYLRRGTSPLTRSHLIFIFALTPLLFFFFTTKIRERFAHPYLIFLTLYCFHNRRFVFWYLATFIYFLQLESVLQYTRVHGGVFTRMLDTTNLYNPTFVAALFFVLIIYLVHLQLRKSEKSQMSTPSLIDSTTSGSSRVEVSPS